jgi:hypothetical protein
MSGMMSEPKEEQKRESVWSVAARWVPWCLALIFLLTIGWTAFVAWTLAKYGSYTSASLLAVDTAEKSGPAAPLILLLAVCLISLADSTEGMIVVTKRYLDSKLVEPIRKQLREEGREEGREQERQIWEAWNNRRLEAEARGESFSEPPPDSSCDNGNG